MAKYVYFIVLSLETSLLDFSGDLLKLLTDVPGTSDFYRILRHPIA